MRLLLKSLSDPCSSLDFSTTAPAQPHHRTSFLVQGHTPTLRGAISLSLCLSLLSPLPLALAQNSHPEAQLGEAGVSRADKDQATQ